MAEWLPRSTAPPSGPPLGHGGLAGKLGPGPGTCLGTWSRTKGVAMKALVYHGPGLRAWETVHDPTVLEPTDAVVQIDSSTICGTDLHILKGDVPEVKPGTVLGHEAVVTVVETGAGVATLNEGDRVLMSCITSCGHCRFCREGHYGL